MSKEEYLALAAQRYESLKELENQPDFYRYEEAFDQIWTDLGLTVLESSISTVPADHRKKNFVRTRYGRIAVAKTHSFSQPVLGSRTSPYLQAKLTLLGCEHVFSDVPPLVESLLGIAVNESQVYRICQQAAVEAQDMGLESPSEKLARIESQPATDDGWQETKVGRVFKATPLEGSSPAKWQLARSEYVAQRGHYREFTAKFEQLLPPESACKKVFISDGALWIAHWLWESYPKAVHILDFYHGSEKLALAAQSTANARQWHQQQSEWLLEGELQKVVQAVKEVDFFPSAEKEKLLHYLESNAYRMQYNQYRKQGLMISSGPIESAHRTVLQVRMKRSGQRWANLGCDNMIRLRAAYKSEKFHLITDLFRQAA